MNPIGKTNKRLRQFVKCTVQNLGDIRLNEQAFGFHTQVVDFVGDCSLEVLFTTLGTKESALDQNGTRAENDFPIAQLQLSSETTNV